MKCSHKAIFKNNKRGHLLSSIYYGLEIMYALEGIVYV